jgi:hypothetical protein
MRAVRRRFNDKVMVTSADPQQFQHHNILGIRVAQELSEADRQRFRRISVRGLLCGFVESVRNEI